MNYDKRTGKIIIPMGVRPESHELDTADVFLAAGFDVEFIAPSRTKGSKTPDVKINGVLWEIKSPLGSTKKTVERQLQRAGKQSKNIIFDSRRTKLDDTYIEKEVRRQLNLSKSIKIVIFIKKDSTKIDIKR